MADVISLNDGSCETVFDLRDFMGLVDRCIGPGAVRWLEEYLEDLESCEEYAKYLEGEIERMRLHKKEVMEKLREQSEIIAGLIGEKDIDRKALSAAAGKIGMITWEEVNG